MPLQGLDTPCGRIRPSVEFDMAGTWSGTHYFGDDTNEVITGTAADETIDALARE